MQVLKQIITTHHSQATYKVATLSQITTCKRRISSAKKISSPSAITYSACEMDSHADTIVAGKNCVVLQYTGKECDVSPYRDDYKSIRNVPIVHAATAWQSSHTGQTYILVLNEALWMGDQIDHTLINPNQLRHFGTKVQDDPTSLSPLSIITEDNEFCMELAMDGTIVYANTHTPSSVELETCPHIQLSSSYPWDPKNVEFPKCNTSLKDVIGTRHMNVVNIL